MDQILKDHHKHVEKHPRLESIFLPNRIKHITYNDNR